jgi:ElaB/YqjD/DUF883 family membrane-anchored ribosome-binding protein
MVVSAPKMVIRAKSHTEVSRSSACSIGLGRGPNHGEGDKIGPAATSPLWPVVFWTDRFTTEQIKNTNPMNKHTQAITADAGTLAEDARALISATADVAGEKVSEARRRLAAALENGKEMYGRMIDKGVEGAKVADRAVHTHPYESIGIALGLGALIGFLVARRCARQED